MQLGKHILHFTNGVFIYTARSYKVLFLHALPTNQSKCVYYNKSIGKEL